MLKRLLLGVLAATLVASLVEAAPQRIIILRHGEKDNAWQLCGVGQERAEALRAEYLGRGAAKSLFRSGEEPAGFFVITLHTLELAAPSATSWGKPLIMYSVVPAAGEKRDRDRGKDEAEAALNRRTQEAVNDLLHDPRWQGKTVVLTWEHKHIADKKLERAYEGEAVTLRQLLNLDKLDNVPETWPAGTYDYFWIVEYGASGDVPTRFTMVKQEFGADYDVPDNDWGEPNGLDKASDCDLKGAD